MITITETREISDVLQCVPMECTIRTKGRDIMPVKDMLSLCKKAFEVNPNFHFFLFHEDEKLIGYLVLIINFEKPKSIHIYRVWTDTNFPEVITEGWRFINEIAKMVKINRVTIEAYDNEEALERRWGFRKVSTIMERRI